MLLIIRLSLFYIFLTGCDEIGQVLGKEKTKATTYSFDCLDSTLSGKPMNRNIEKASDILRDLAISKKTITDSLQTAYGKEFHLQMTKAGSFKLANNLAARQKLNIVLKELLATRETPSKIEYAIYI